MDISGKRFGRLVAAKASPRKSADGTEYWICMCDCGACTAASFAALTGGQTTSCGCEKLIGKRFGWLTVQAVERGGRIRCRCACGRERTLPRGDLKNAVSCGCELEQKEQAELEGQLSFYPQRNAVPAI